jgi:hypothetical protein
MSIRSLIEGRQRECCAHEKAKSGSLGRPCGGISEERASCPDPHLHLLGDAMPSSKRLASQWASIAYSTASTSVATGIFSLTALMRSLGELMRGPPGSRMWSNSGHSHHSPPKLCPYLCGPACAIRCRSWWRPLCQS